MRDYAKVGPQFWIGKTGKRLRAAGHEAQIVGMYLMTSPHANMLGLYYVTMQSIAHETGLGMKGAALGLRHCIDADYCSYCPESEVVWVHEMAFYQIADTLAAADKRSVGVQHEYDALPANPYLARFFVKYAGPFNMTRMRGNIDAGACHFEGPSKPLASPSEGACKGLRSQEQEQDQQQEQVHEQHRQGIARAGADVQTIFDYWRKVMGSPRSAMDGKRRALIANALKRYSPGDVCRAIRGCSKSPHHMGVNDRNTKYNGLGLILRDAEHIDQFIRLDDGKARSGSETIVDLNARAAAQFLGAPCGEPDTVDMVA